VSFVRTIHFKAVTSRKKKDIPICEVTDVGFVFSPNSASTYQTWNKDLMCWDICDDLPSDFKARIECDDDKMLYHTSTVDDSFHIRFNNLRKPDGTLMTKLYM
jgi:hypothetical protein